MFSLPYVVIDHEVIFQHRPYDVLGILQIEDEEWGIDMSVFDDHNGHDGDKGQYVANASLINDPRYYRLLGMLNTAIAEVDADSIDINIDDDDMNVFVSSIVCDYGEDYANHVFKEEYGHSIDATYLFDDSALSNDEAEEYIRNVIRRFVDIVRMMNDYIE